MKKAIALIHEFTLFGLKQARACAFAGSFFVILFLSHHISFGLPRYDFLFLAAVLIQVFLVYLRIETVDEVKTIALFHIIGLCLKLFKTHPSVGSWSYPEFGYLKIATVPLYSGFMYAAVGSYIAQSWRIFDLKLTNMPPYWLSGGVGTLIYLNFFTHHFIPDFRYALMLVILVIFGRSRVKFTVTDKVRKMPLTLSFVLIAFFIWVAENISTFLGAWKYPEQMLTWTTVSIHKVGSWSLLVIISFILVAYLKTVKQARVTV